MRSSSSSEVNGSMVKSEEISGQVNATLEDKLADRLLVVPMLLRAVAAL